MPPIALGIPVAAPDARPDTPLVFGRRADEVGAHSVWMVDRLVFGNYEPLISLAAVAGTTTRVRLGTGVLLGTLRPPLVLAKMVATLDALSNGRVLLGMGVGRREEDFAGAGTPFAQRGPRLTELIQVLRKTWSGDPVQHNGRFWQIEVGAIGPRPAQSHVPIFLGGSADAALRRVARHADGYVGSSGGGVAGFRERVDRIRRYAEEAGRDPRSMTMIGVAYGCVDPNRERARDLAARYTAHYYGAVPRDLDATHFLGDAAEGERLVNGFVEAGADILCLSPVTADPRNLDYLTEQLLPRVLG